jgi:hypothetical protein
MKGNIKKYPNDFLKYLYKHYTAWDVPINTYFKKHFRVTESSDNEGRKIVEFLEELKANKMISWVTQPEFDNTQSVTVSKYTFNARLTFEGLNYISGYIRLKRQFWMDILKGAIGGIIGALITMLLQLAT